MPEVSIETVTKLVEQLHKEEEFLRIFKTLFVILFFAILFISTTLLSTQGGVFGIRHVSSIISHFEEIGSPPSFTKASLIIFVLSGLVWVAMLALFIREWFASRKGYFWSADKGLYDWDFQGNIIVDKKKNAMHILHSDLGCIIKGKGWKNFDMFFEFKIPKQISCGYPPSVTQLERGFGIIYRAKQLGQYYMLKVDKSGYQPHVRNVFWENNGPIHETTLSDLDLDNWVPVKLSIRDNLLTVIINDSDRFSFVLPTHSNIQRDFSTSIKDKEELEASPYKEIPFRKSGSVGFRSAPLEEVYISKLTVVPESLHQYIGRKLKRAFFKRLPTLRVDKGLTKSSTNSTT